MPAIAHIRPSGPRQVDCSELSDSWGHPRILALAKTAERAIGATIRRPLAKLLSAGLRLRHRLGRLNADGGCDEITMASALSDGVRNQWSQGRSGQIPGVSGRAQLGFWRSIARPCWLWHSSTLLLPRDINSRGWNSSLFWDLWQKLKPDRGRPARGIYKPESRMESFIRAREDPVPSHTRHRRRSLAGCVDFLYGTRRAWNVIPSPMIPFANSVQLERLLAGRLLL